MTENRLQPELTDVEAPRKFRVATYENGLIIVLSLVVACMLMDRVTVFVLAPFIAKDLHLNNAKIGLLASALSVTIAVSGYLISALAEAKNRRKLVLIICTAGFAIMTFITRLAPSFSFLATCRLITGIADGPMTPLPLSIMSAESTPSRRSLNLGFLQNFCPFVLAQMLGPILLVAIATRFGWRDAFFVTGVPALLLVGLMYFFTREPKDHKALPSGSAHAAKTKSSLGALFKYRNIWLCGGISAGVGSWIFLQLTFLPLYLIQKTQLSPSRMGVVVAMTGISGSVASLLLPWLSDKFGRKSVLLAGLAIGLAMPLSVLFLHSYIGLLLGVLAGSCGMGLVPIYVAIIPSETVPFSMGAQAVAFALASSEMIGGILSPAIGGRLADIFSLRVPFWMAAGALVVASVLVPFLDETSSRKTAQSA